MKCFIQPAGHTDFKLRSAVLPTRTMPLWIVNKSLLKASLAEGKWETQRNQERASVTISGGKTYWRQKRMSASFPAEGIGD